MGASTEREPAPKRAEQKKPVYFEKPQYSDKKSSAREKGLIRPDERGEEQVKKTFIAPHISTKTKGSKKPVIDKKPGIAADAQPVVVQKPRRKKEKLTPAPSSWYELNVTEPVVPNVTLVSVPNSPKLIDISLMSSLQVDGKKSDEREVNIGLDFGTSSIKVVIGDSVIGKAFAVPFFETAGLDQYLLPSRVWYDSEKKRYTITNEGHAVRNLKLNLIKPTCSVDEFSHAAALLALVIMHARAWLLSEHRDIYQRTKILWKLTVGFPAQGYDNEKLIKKFQKLAAASWQLSLRDDKEPPKEVVEKTCKKALFSESSDPHEIFKDDTVDVEIDIVPELSAQIYGFLTSEKFDRRARNIFMIVDVGAGTIDSSIFRVREGKAKSLSFDFFANSVEFNGVVNLHKYRISWLRHIFNNENRWSDLVNALESMDGPTDYLRNVPETINGYFKGLNFSFLIDKKSPDERFFKEKLLKQVLEETLKRAVDVNQEPSVLTGMPVFICGGGSRMQYYQNLQSKLISHPNASWFKFKPRKLEVPDILSAPGVIKDDFDRLSVAFGLSFIRVGEIVRAVKAPPLKVTGPKRVCPGCGSHTTCYCG